MRFVPPDSSSPNRQKPRKAQIGRFQCFARATARAAGSSWAFGLALAIIVVWAFLGPLFHFSDTWQLVINTGTTIITFLMVFLIQSTQNRDSEAMHLKLDELLRAQGGAHNAVLDIEEMSEEELAALKRAYALLARQALRNVHSGKSDLGVPELNHQPAAPAENDTKLAEKQNH
jgi:low affinity Fe/Cu permease